MSLQVPARREVKAGPVGPGAGVMLTEYLMPMMLPTDAQRKIRMALKVASEVSWIRAAERVIAGKVGGDAMLSGTVGWHLEDPDGETIDDDYPDARARAAHELLECPIAGIAQPDRQFTVARYQADLWAITARHMGIAGQGYWYLDGLDGLGIPRGTLYIAPDRLIPWADSVGNLEAWSLDPKDANRPETGRRLELDEVLQFPLEVPDHGFIAAGLIESAILKAQLGGQVDKFLGSMLGSSGKLSGMFAPTGGAIEDDGTWDQLVRDMRNIAEQPDAAKRMQLMRSPMAYTRTQATIAEMAIIELMVRNRDELLALWGVPLSQLGGLTPAGLNSGDVRKYDEAALWQNAIVPRLAPLRARIQTVILDRWEAWIGWAPQLVLEIPEFDDDSPRYDKLAKSVTIVMTNDERRALIGLEPLPDPVLGGQIVMPVTVVPFASVTTMPVPGASAQAIGEATAGPAAPSQASGIPDSGPEQPSLATTARMPVPAGGAGATLKADVLPAVLAALRKQWPESALREVSQGRWTFDPKFPMDKINAARRPIARNPRIVAGAEAVLAIGAPIAPVTLIHTKRIGKPGYEPIDGWHRILAAQHQGLDTIPAYVGEGDDAWTHALIAIDDEIPTPPSSAADEEPAKAATRRSTMTSLRTALTAGLVPQLQSAVGRVLAAQRREIATRVRANFAALQRNPRDQSVWWARNNDWDERLVAALRPGLAGMATEVAGHIHRTYGPQKASPTGAVAHVITSGATRVGGINATTRDGLAQVIAQGLTDGLSPAELGDAIEAWSGFDEARAEMIARTEMAAAYNAAAITSYGEVGVEYVEAIDGDGDPECAERDGQTFSLDEASTIEDHPNGTLDWVPVPPAEEKARVDGGQSITLHIPAPVVNIPRTVVNVPAPVVNVGRPKRPKVRVDVAPASAPVVNVAPADVRVRSKRPRVTVNVPPSPRTHRVIERDRDGTITGVRDEPDEG